MSDDTETWVDGCLRLRAFRKTDAVRLANIVRASADSISPWLSWCHAGYGIDEAREFIMQAQQGEISGNGPFDMAVEIDGELSGSVRLRWISQDDRVINLGYWLCTDAQGKGLATRASRLALTRGFGPLGAQRIEILAAEDNRASRRVAEKLGPVSNAWRAIGCVSATSR